MTQCEELVTRFRSYEKGALFSTLDEHLSKKGFSKIARAATLGYQTKIEGTQTLIFAIRMSNLSGIFSFSKSYWEKRRDEIANISALFRSFDIEPTEKKVSASQYSMLQIRFNQKNLPLIEQIISDAAGNLNVTIE